MTGSSERLGLALDGIRERWSPLPFVKVLREPLVHFLALGSLLFLFFAWRAGGSGAGSNRIVITPGHVERLASGFARTRQRPPTEAELKEMVDDHVKEEIAVREASAMGLDRDDTIIRRRLRQKLEFLVEDAVPPAPPTDAEVRAWVNTHPDAFGAAPPDLAVIRPMVERELLAERGKKGLSSFYERMLAKYSVTIEMPKAKAGAPEAR